MSAAVAAVLVIGAVTTVMVLSRSGDSPSAAPEPAMPTAAGEAAIPGDAPTPLYEVCEPEEYGEIRGEGTGPTTIPLDDLPERLFLLTSVTYTPAPDVTDAFDYFYLNLGFDRQEYSHISVTGEHAGAYLLRYESHLGVPSHLAIETTGEWTVLVQHLSAAPAWPDVTNGGGSLVLCVPPGALGGPTTVVADHDGSFSVYYYDGSEPPEAAPYQHGLLRERSAGTSELVLPESTYLIEVFADAPWTLSIP